MPLRLRLVTSQGMRLDETLRLRLVTSQGKNRLVSYTPLAPGQCLIYLDVFRPCRRYLSPEKLRELLFKPSAR